MGVIWLPMIFLFVQQQFISPDFGSKQALMRRFLLTDYCLSTESRHTRQLNFPELIAPFQDLPGGHEHFPSSSFLWPNPDRFRAGFVEEEEE